MNWKPWRDGLLIPDTRTPGVKKDYMSGKRKANTGSEHQSRGNKAVAFWPVGKWAHGFTSGERKK